MEVYPTAPFDTKAHQLNVDTPSAHAGMGENVESPGKGMMSKVKDKARKLKHKIKKATGSNTASTEHGDNNEHDKRDFNTVFGPDGKNVDDVAESHDDDDEEEAGYSKPNDNQFKYEQLRSIGALDDHGDGSEVEVHGGVPVSTLADSPGTYWKREDDDAPISPYKSAGPPDALQATPTEYRNYAADGGDKPTSNVLSEKYSGSDEGNLPAISASGAEPHSKQDALDTVTYPEDIVKPNPSFGESSPPIYDKIAVMDEDLSADKKLGVRPCSEEHGGSTGEGNSFNMSASEFKPEAKMSNFSNYDPAEPQSKYGVSSTASASDIDVPYPEDLVKPNRSFGKSSSPTYDKIGVLNEDLSSDGKVGVGLLSEEHSGSGKGNLLQTSVPEFEELSGYRGSPSVSPETDALVYRPVSEPEVGFSSPPGTLDDEPNAVSHSSGSGLYLDDRSGVDNAHLRGENAPPPTGASAPPPTGASSYSEQKPTFDVPSEQPADAEVATAGDSEQEAQGKWSADKIKNAKDVSVSGLIGTDYKDDYETQENITDGRGSKLNKAVDVVGNANKVPNLQDDDMAKPRALENESKDVEEEFYDPNVVPNAGDVVGNANEVANLQDDDTAKPRALENENKDVEEEFYDPNDVKDNQFQEGFTLGSAEEDALSGTLAGSAIEKLQGLKETVQSSLGYSNHDGSAAGREVRAGFEGEETALSPTSHNQQKGGFVQGLKETVASSLGYGKASTDEVVNNNDDPEGEQRSETEVDSRQQPSPGGTYQVFKNAVASKLGYGTADASPPTPPKQTESLHQPTTPKQTESREFPAELDTSHEPSHKDSGDHQNVIEAGHASSDVRDTTDTQDGVSSQQQSGGVLQGVKDMVSTKLGYSSRPDETYRDTIHTESASVPAGDNQPSSYTQKFMNTTAAARDYLSSRVGYGNSHENKGEEGDFDDGEKFTKPSTHGDNKY